MFPIQSHLVLDTGQIILRSQQRYQIRICRRRPIGQAQLLARHGQPMRRPHPHLIRHLRTILNLHKEVQLLLTHSLHLNQKLILRIIPIDHLPLALAMLDRNHRLLRNDLRLHHLDLLLPSHHGHLGDAGYDVDFDVEGLGARVGVLFVVVGAEGLVVAPHHAQGHAGLPVVD